MIEIELLLFNIDGFGTRFPKCSFITIDCCFGYAGPFINISSQNGVQSNFDDFLLFKCMKKRQP